MGDRIRLGLSRLFDHDSCIWFILFFFGIGRVWLLLPPPGELLNYFVVTELHTRKMQGPK